MTYEGAIHDRDLADALLAVGREKRTGILTVQGEEEIIGVSFLSGEVVSADALNQSLEEGLGEVLASRDLVRPEDFATLAAEHQAGGGRVVDLLVERSYLTAKSSSGRCASTPIDCAARYFIGAQANSSSTGGTKSPSRMASSPSRSKS